MKCLNCSKEFESKRVTAKFCSAKCRKLAFQNTKCLSVLSVPEVSVPEVAEEIIELVKENSTSDETEFVPQDLNMLNFNGDVNAYQAYVHQRNAATRNRILNTSIKVLKSLNVFIPAWRYELG